MDTLSIGALIALERVMTCAERGAVVVWLDGGVTRTGTARAIKPGASEYGFMTERDDVRNGYLMVTTTVTDIFLPVREVVAMVRRGEFAEVAS